MLFCEMMRFVFLCCCCCSFSKRTVAYIFLVITLIMDLSASARLLRYPMSCRLTSVFPISKVSGFVVRVIPVLARKTFNRDNHVPKRDQGLSYLKLYAIWICRAQLSVTRLRVFFWLSALLRRQCRNRCKIPGRQLSAIPVVLK
uniref:Uncharacterized protein n=1 Tax=Ixodes ricinus TaxID=34613 RepID=A0A6B0UU95_IXORI